MEESHSDREKRRNPRFIVDLPLEYRVTGGPCLRGGIVVNASEGGFLIETTRDIPVGTELNITVLFLNGFELSNFDVVAKIVWKEPYRREDWKGVPFWEGYQYGLKFVHISQEDRLKLNSLLGGQFEFEETFSVLSCGL